MKTLMIFIFGLAVGLMSTHYYSHEKKEYFSKLYSEYVRVNYNQLTPKQFEHKWLATTPWCFATPEKNICNSATVCNPENNETHMVPKNNLVHVHQRLINWYPKAKTAIHDIQNWAVTTWEKQIGQLN